MFFLYCEPNMHFEAPPSVQVPAEMEAFFDKHQPNLNEAQSKVLNRMLEEGEGNFLGSMNARKYQAIAKVSKATATRHLQDLVEKGLLIVQKGGRSTHYQINLALV